MMYKNKRSLEELSLMFESTSIKAYVHVSVDFDDTGRMCPTSILWEDGTHYEIDRVLDVRPAFAARAGGQGDRYTIRLGEQITYLFFEHNVDYGSHIPGRWFVERKA